MTKYVINDKFGGFGLSNEAFEYLLNEKKWNLVALDDRGFVVGEKENAIFKFDKPIFGQMYGFAERTYELEFRSRPDIVEVVEVLGKKANGCHAYLIIVEAPESNIEIDDYDGQETLQSIPTRY